MATGSDGRSQAAGPCFEKALDLLSRRPHFRRELERKLSMREFDQAEIRSALDRAAELGYQDDLECARELARARVERRFEGPALLLATLTRRGSDPQVARQVVDESYASGEGPWLAAAAAKWLRGHPWDRERLARHLSRRGFSMSAILESLKRLEPAAGEVETGIEEP